MAIAGLAPSWPVAADLKAGRQARLCVLAGYGSLIAFPV
jgi:hypothetical protein